MSHPLYTYAFFSPRTKRVLYRQDAIFLVTTFPMRIARANSGLPADGEPLVAVRSSLAPSLPDFASEFFSFDQWQAGDLLPHYVNHATGVPLVDDPNFSCHDSPALPHDWPHRYPHHPSFGSQSTVPVPVSPLFPSPSSLVPPLTPSFLWLPVHLRAVVMEIVLRISGDSLLTYLTSSYLVRLWIQLLAPCPIHLWILMSALTSMARTLRMGYPVTARHPWPILFQPGIVISLGEWAIIYCPSCCSFS
jgi:hypothetical protein